MFWTAFLQLQNHRIPGYSRSKMSLDEAPAKQPRLLSSRHFRVNTHASQDTFNGCWMTLTCFRSHSAAFKLRQPLRFFNLHADVIALPAVVSRFTDFEFAARPSLGFVADTA